MGCSLDPGQNWKCAYNSHPSAETDRQRRTGAESMFLVKLGCDYRVGRKENFFHETVHQSHCCQQQQFSPSELIGASVAVLCRLTETKTTEKTRKKTNKVTVRGRHGGKECDYFCHSRRVRYNQRTDGFRGKVLFPKSERGITARANVISCACKVLILHMLL